MPLQHKPIDHVVQETEKTSGNALKIGGLLVGQQLAMAAANDPPGFSGEPALQSPPPYAGVVSPEPEPQIPERRIRKERLRKQREANTKRYQEATEASPATTEPSLVTYPVHSIKLDKSEALEKVCTDMFLHKFFGGRGLLASLEWKTDAVGLLQKYEWKFESIIGGKDVKKEMTKVLPQLLDEIATKIKLDRGKYNRVSVYKSIPRRSQQWHKDFDGVSQDVISVNLFRHTASPSVFPAAPTEIFVPNPHGKDWIEVDKEMIRGDHFVDPPENYEGGCTQMQWYDNSQVWHRTPAGRAVNHTDILAIRFHRNPFWWEPGF